jgi:hypothetical protein
MHFQLEFAIPQLLGFHSRVRVCKLKFHVCFVSNSPSTTSICHSIVYKVPIRNFKFAFLEFHICLVPPMHLQFEPITTKFGRFPTL